MSKAGEEAMVKWIILVFVLYPVVIVLGADFELEDELVNHIYQKSIEKAQADTQEDKIVFRLVPGFSFGNFSELTLANDYFTVPYSESAKYYPGIYIDFVFPLSKGEKLDLFVWGEIGAGYREGQEKVISQLGTERNDMVSLYWIPLSLALRIEYKMVGMVKPSLTVGLGGQWFYQTGNLDGIGQGFWIPFYLVKPSLVLFQSQRGKSLFGGIEAGVSFKSAWGTDQQLRSWSADLGLIVNL